MRLEAREKNYNLPRLMVHCNKKYLFQTWIMLLKIFPLIENFMCSGGGKNVMHSRSCTMTLVTLE